MIITLESLSGNSNISVVLALAFVIFSFEQCGQIFLGGEGGGEEREGEKGGVRGSWGGEGYQVSLVCLLDICGIVGLY